MAFLLVDIKMFIHPSQIAPIALLIGNEVFVTIFAEYFDYTDIFSKIKPIL